MTTPDIPALLILLVPVLMALSAERNGVMWDRPRRRTWKVNWR